jgi:ribonuclease BN (tRNA processing enzyme)
MCFQCIPSLWALPWTPDLGELPGGSRGGIVNRGLSRAHMQVQILSAAAGPDPELQYLSSYLINGSVAVDAGSLGIWASPAGQQPVSHVVLTHCHEDHIASLPFFLENVYCSGHGLVTVCAHRQTLDALQSHLFNGEIWPDFFRLMPERPFVRLQEVIPEQPFAIGNLRFLPVEVPHTVKALGYIVTDGASTAIFGGDSGPTERLWELAASSPAPRIVLLESAFPNSMVELARVAQHLTPADFAREVAKLPPVEKIVAIHLKPRFRDVIIRELQALSLPNLVIGECGRTYEV